MEKIIIICGPTASGKTAYAYRLAGDKPTSIISADSRQVYAGLDIITGKDIPPGFIKKDSGITFNNRPVKFYAKANLRLWGFDLLKPNESFNAAEFADLTNQIISRESEENRQIMIVGGTGFYLKALTEPQSLAQVPPDENLRHELEKLSLDQLQQKLKSLHPQKFVSFNQSDVSNPRRLIRAIEVGLSSQKNRPNPEPVEGEINFSWLSLRQPLDILKQKISKRVISRLDAGAIEEVEALMEDYPDETLPVYTSLGINFLVKYLKREIDKETLIKLWTNEEVAYAKRQITWFKKQPQIIWYDQNEVNNLNLDKLL